MCCIKCEVQHTTCILVSAAVEDVVSYGVKKKYQSSFSLAGTSPPPSVKILKTLAESKQYELPSELWKKSVEESKRERVNAKDRTTYPAQFILEEKILWVKIALVEKMLLDYVDLLMSLKKNFYTRESILGDPIHADIFRNLLAGPMVLRISRMKHNESVFTTPTPHELVHRHAVFDKKKVHYSHHNISDEMDLWSHVKSLYQTTSSTCLYGKNNILKKLDCTHSYVQQAHATYPKFSPGYLSLHKGNKEGLELKWIPIDMLNCTQEDPEAELTLRESLKYVLTCDIERDVAHIHCHRTKDNQYYMILVGYDGIAIAPLIFHHQSSLLAFLECVDSGLLPQGCLEPPVWFLKNQIGVTPTEDKEDELSEPWNQVFHVRTVHRRIKEEPILQPSVRGTMMTEDDLEALKKIGMEDWKVDCKSPVEASTTCDNQRRNGEEPERPLISAMLKAKRAVNKERLENFQSKVSRPLIARYFYSWLSYCRHMSKARKRVSHMADARIGLPPTPTEKLCLPLQREEWEGIKRQKDPSSIKEMSRKIYLGGIEDGVRSEIWPYLLELYQLGSTDSGLYDLNQRLKEEYRKALESWRKLEEAQSTLKALMSRLVDSECVDGIQDNRDAGEECQSMYLESDTTLEKDNSSVEPIEYERPTSASTSGSDVFSPMKSTFEPDTMTTRGYDGSTSNESPVMTIELEVHTKSESDRRQAILEEINDCFEQLPLEMKSQVKADECGEWNYQKFLELSEIQYLTTQLIQLDKDVRRCDRELPYFQKDANLTKVRNIVMTYCWRHQDLGYVQGMCDILAPLLVLLDNECLVYHCYLKVMERMQWNFPPNIGVSEKLSNLRALVEVMEPEFFQYLSQQSTGEDFLFAYRWFLLDFKREFGYDQIFRVWEVIICSAHCASALFQEFLALALIKKYM
jgi:hypothetical protein